MISSYLNDIQSRYKRNGSGYEHVVNMLKEAEEKGYLFHGSPEGNLRVLKPTHTLLTNGQPVVFAGKAWAAVASTAKWNDDDFDQGTINGVPYMEAKKPGAFSRYKDGGWIYVVSPMDFEWDSRLTRFEFISRKPVEVIWGIYVKNPVYTMKALGVELKL